MKMMIWPWHGANGAQLLTAPRIHIIIINFISDCKFVYSFFLFLYLCLPRIIIAHVWHVRVCTWLSWHIRNDANETIKFRSKTPDAPSCSPNQPRVYGVAKQEQAQIRCTVDANPADVEFKWTFNNSAESIDVANNHVTRSGKVPYHLESTNPLSVCASVQCGQTRVQIMPTTHWRIGASACRQAHTTHANSKHVWTFSAGKIVTDDGPRKSALRQTKSIANFAKTKYFGRQAGNCLRHSSISCKQKQSFAHSAHRRRYGRGANHQPPVQRTLFPIYIIQSWMRFGLSCERWTWTKSPLAVCSVCECVCKHTLHTHMTAQQRGRENDRTKIPMQTWFNSKHSKTMQTWWWKCISTWHFLECESNSKNVNAFVDATTSHYHLALMLLACRMCQTNQQLLQLADWQKMKFSNSEFNTFDDVDADVWRVIVAVVAVRQRCPYKSTCFALLMTYPRSNR